MSLIASTFLCLAALGGEPAWGPASEGLRIGISVVAEDADNRTPMFDIWIENVGEEDVIMNLGMMLANGKKQYPVAIRLRILDSQKRSRELHYGDPNVMGRVDDYMVALRVGSRYSVRVSLDKFWCPNTKEFKLELAGGTYEVSAHLTGIGPTHPNTGTEGLDLLNFWIGELQSNTATFQISRKDYEQ